MPKTQWPCSMTHSSWRRHWPMF